jgi:hypothetical protein
MDLVARGHTKNQPIERR